MSYAISQAGERIAKSLDKVAAAIGKVQSKPNYFVTVQVPPGAEVEAIVERVLKRLEETERSAQVASNE